MTKNRDQEPVAGGLTKLEDAAITIAASFIARTGYFDGIGKMSVKVVSEVLNALEDRSAY